MEYDDCCIFIQVVKNSKVSDYFYSNSFVNSPAGRKYSIANWIWPAGVAEMCHETRILLDKNIEEHKWGSTIVFLGNT